MEIQALAGKSKCGKTHTLNILYQQLLSNGYKQVPDYFRNLSNNDIIDVLEKGNKRIGIVTQGDYIGTANSIANHLKKLASAGCIQAICACTTDKPKAKGQVMVYTTHTFVHKSISNSPRQQLLQNKSDANLIFQAIELSIG